MPDSVFLIAFFINSIILTIFAGIIRARWWESIAPLPVPVVIASICIMVGNVHDGLIIQFTFGVPIIISAGVVYFFKAPLPTKPIA